MSSLDALAIVQKALERAELRLAELEREVQDFDAELAACDDPHECRRIATARMSKALELAQGEVALRGVAGTLALIAREESGPHAVRWAA